MAGNINHCLSADFIFLILRDDGNDLSNDFRGGYMTIYLAPLTDTLVYNSVLKTGTFYCM